MADLHQQWLFKDRNGKVIGPFRTSQVLDMIESGRISGDEHISQYPGGEWFPVSREPEFYDKLLEALVLNSGASAQAKSPAASSRADRVETSRDEPRAQSSSKRSEFSEASIDRSSNNERSRGSAIVEQPRAPHGPRDANADSDRKAGKREKSRDKEEVLELANVKNVKKQLKKEKAKAAGLPLIIVAVALAVAASVLMNEKPNTLGKIHLLAPQQGKPPLEAGKARKLLRQSIDLFQRDTFDNYLKAQNTLVQVLEGAPSTSDALSLLCLTYRELWPFSYRDESDLKAVSAVLQLTALGDALGYHSAVCNIVFLLLTAKYENAEQLIDSGLATYPPGPILYEFKADLLGARRDYSTGMAYLDKTRQLWKEWLKPYVSEAIFRQENGDYGQAARLLKAVLKSNPQHQVAQIYLGILEARHFHHLAQGYDLIRAGVRDGQNLAPTVLGEAYLSLAEIALASNKRGEALKWAEKSYAAYPVSKRVRELMVELGHVRPGEVSISEGELIYLGEQYMKQGNFFAAQAEFKAAFKQNPKSAIAAFKAAQSLWRLNQSKEAIDWLKKATRADPKNLEAYVTLADYYSQRFDFLSASTVLQQAQRLRPRSYEVQRGLALFELRRKSYQGAINFGLKALKIYETDIDTHLILVDAYLGLNNYQEALKYARRATEVDSNNVASQVALAKVMAGTQGVEAAVYQMKRLIEAYPHIIEYRMGLGEIYYNDQRYRDAEGVFRMITEVEANNKAALIYLAKTSRELDRPQEALSLLLTAATLDPADGEPLFEAGLLYIQAKKFNHAITQFQRVLVVNPNYPRTHYFMGQAAFLSGDFQKAIDEAMTERRLNPSVADSYLLAGEVYLASQQYSNCVGEFQEAIKRRPQGADIYVKAAKCYRLSGSLDYAIRMLDLAKGKESGYPEIYKELGAAYETKGDTDNATAAYGQYFMLFPNAPDRKEIEGRLQGFPN